MSPAALIVHVAHHAQTVDRGLERAQLVGELLGQHRNDAPRKVHRRAALARIEVDGIAVAHVVADVGDGHEQAEIAALALAVHSVVEIARRFAVDGDQRQRAQVDATLEVAGLHGVAAGGPPGAWRRR